MNDSPTWNMGDQFMMLLLNIMTNLRGCAAVCDVAGYWRFLDGLMRLTSPFVDVVAWDAQMARMDSLALKLWSRGGGTQMMSMQSVRNREVLESEAYEELRKIERDYNNLIRELLLPLNAKLDQTVIERRMKVGGVKV